MAVLVMMGIGNPLYVVALAVINGTLRATQQTAAQSLAPNLVDRERLPNAVALNEAMQQGSRLFGPLILFFVSYLAGVGGLGQGDTFWTPRRSRQDWGTSAVVFWACATFYLLALISALNIRTVSSGVIDRRQQLLGQHNRRLRLRLQHALVFGII